MSDDADNLRAVLTKPYLVYLAVHDTDVTLPAGLEFELIGQLRDVYHGLYQHPEYGEIFVQTSDAVKLLRTGDAVQIECEGRTVVGKVILASPNGASLMLEFEAILDGCVGAMPVLREADGNYHSLMTGIPVKLL